jgi:5-methylcytosine-specific restriction endonuclease McrA
MAKISTLPLTDVGSAAAAVVDRLLTNQANSVDERVIVTRKAAMSSGNKKYFTGQACKHGHVDYRSTANGACYACSRNKSRRFRIENPEVAIERDRASRDKSKEKRKKLWAEWYQRNKNALLERNKIKRKDDREGSRAKGRASYIRTAEKRRAYAKEYRLANPEKRIAWQANRRARHLSAEGSYSLEDIVRIRSFQKDKCALCRMRLKGGGHVDHIQPISKGGSNWPRNLQILCEPCNISKHDNDQLVYLRRKGMLL